jgi:hypothetical protein
MPFRTDPNLRFGLTWIPACWWNARNCNQNARKRVGRDMVPWENIHTLVEAAKKYGKN